MHRTVSAINLTATDDTHLSTCTAADNVHLSTCTVADTHTHAHGRCPCRFDDLHMHGYTQPTHHPTYTQCGHTQSAHHPTYTKRGQTVGRPPRIHTVDRLRQPTTPHTHRADRHTQPITPLPLNPTQHRAEQHEQGTNQTTQALLLPSQLAKQHTFTPATCALYRRQAIPARAQAGTNTHTHTHTCASKPGTRAAAASLRATCTSSARTLSCKLRRSCEAACERARVPCKLRKPCEAVCMCVCNVRLQTLYLASCPSPVREYVCARECVLQATAFLEWQCFQRMPNKLKDIAARCFSRRRMRDTAACCCTSCLTS